MKGHLSSKLFNHLSTPFWGWILKWKYPEWTSVIFFCLELLPWGLLLSNMFNMWFWCVVSYNNLSSTPQHRGWCLIFAWPVTFFIPGSWTSSWEIQAQKRVKLCSYVVIGREFTVPDSQILEAALVLASWQQIQKIFLFSDLPYILPINFCLSSKSLFS